MTLAAGLVDRLAELPGVPRILLDGVGGHHLADAVMDGLTAAGRTPVRICTRDFWRPAGERLQHGREDAEAFRGSWLDAGALRREVLEADGTVLTALWDVDRDRSARRSRRPLPPRAVLLVDGLFLLGLGLPAELVVHVGLSAAALLRRGVPAWQLPAFATYDELAQPSIACDVLVRAEDPLRPAVRWPSTVRPRPANR